MALSVLNDSIEYSHRRCVCVCVVITFGRLTGRQLGIVANPARGQLNTEIHLLIFACPRSRLILWSSETGSPVPLPVGPLPPRLNHHLALTRGLLSFLPLSVKQPPSGQFRRYASGHEHAYRRCSSPRVCQHEARSPQGSTSNGRCLIIINPRTNQSVRPSFYTPTAAVVGQVRHS